MDESKCVFYFKNVDPKTKNVFVTDFANHRSYTLDRWNCVGCPQGKENATMETQIEEVKEKVCATCKKPKPIGKFGVKKSNKDGLSGSCKECIQTYQNAYYAKTHQAAKKAPAKAEKKKAWDYGPPPQKAKEPEVTQVKESETCLPVTNVRIPEFEVNVMKRLAEVSGKTVEEFMITCLQRGIVAIMEERLDVR